MHATVTLDSDFRGGPIDRRLFGGFLEHLGRAVYGGVYDPQNPQADAQGFRRDVLDALADLGMPVVRYPGGNFVSNYVWKHGVGPRSRRPRRPDYAWQSIEPNHFGTDEFVRWCRALGTEPLLAVNLGTGSAAEAAEWVEYCNFPSGTQWSDLRIAHGYRDPYRIELWGLGNEMDGPWQAGHVSAEVYAERAFQASFLMKGIDPKIRTIACGSSGRGMGTYLEWDRKVLEACWDTVDFISAHRYSGNPRDDADWFLAEGIEIDRILDDYASLVGYVRGLKRSQKRVYLAFDEWNVWYRANQDEHVRAGWRVGAPLLEETYNLEDALVCAQYLMAFLRHADLVKVACLAQIVNVIAPVLTSPDGVLLQSIYYPFMLVSRHARGVALTPRIDGPLYRAGERGETPALDAAASFDEETGEICVLLLNRDRARELPVRIKLADREVSGISGVDVLGGGDLKAENCWEHPDRVRSQAGHARLAEGSVELSLRAPGFSVVRLATRLR